MPANQKIIAAHLWSGPRVKKLSARVLETVEARTVAEALALFARIERDRRTISGGDLPWQSGWVGWISYDFGLEHLGARDRRKRRLLPLARFHRVVPASRPVGRSPSDRRPTCRLLSRTDTRATYVRKILDAQEELRAGNAFEINLSQRWAWRFTREPDAFELFEAASRAMRPRFGFFESCGHESIISCSPELFFSIDGRKIIAEPIKGTAAPDAKLLASKKDRAELLMITDLFRNDLGKVCEPGSVQASGPHDMRLPYVRHLYARIFGNLRRGAALGGILEACFPSGSITGAPKIAACRIIDRLEPFAREEAFGAAGWIGRSQMAFTVLIRTALLRGRDLRYTAGGGITVYSNPAKEYEESLMKARTFMKSLPVKNR